MKKLILIFAAMVFLSCRNGNEKSEVELGEYNTEPIENYGENDVLDSAAVDSTTMDSVAVDSAMADTVTKTNEAE